MNDTTTDNVSLPEGCHLDNYVIDHKIGGGGFSIVYLGHVVYSEIQVIVKEYMPRKLAVRGEDGLEVLPKSDAEVDQFNLGKRLFLQEASSLANLKHPNIVNVINFFREHGTVYMVMDYEHGVNMQEYIKRHGGNLSEKFIRTVFMPLLDGLKVIHGKGMLHLDIKPGNIFLRDGGNPLLLDFGAVHTMQDSRKNQAGQVVTIGYSPIEQSTRGGYVGPWSDLYAIGATMRACIEGVAPPRAEERRENDTMRPAREQFRKSYSPGLLEAIDWAMEVEPTHRPQSVDQLIEALSSKRNDEPPEGESGGHSVLRRLASFLGNKE